MLALLALCAVLPLAANSVAQSAVQPPMQSPSAGALLYQTHCIGCHSTQIHWRDDRLARNWATLSAQVRRWQANTGLQWTDEQIDAVARHLNATIYHFPDESARQAG